MSYEFKIELHMVPMKYNETKAEFYTRHKEITT